MPKLFIQASYRNGEDFETYCGLVDAFTWNANKKLLHLDYGTHEDELTEVLAFGARLGDEEIVSPDARFRPTIELLGEMVEVQSSPQADAKGNDFLERLRKTNSLQED